MYITTIYSSVHSQPMPLLSPDETAAAIHLARTRGHLLPHGVMTAFAAACAASGLDLETLAGRALSRSDEHELSKEREAELDDYLARH